jgi:septal ring-binding cell division protein DamX
MSDDVPVGGKGVLSSALLVLAVTAILLTGLVLRTDAQNPGVQAAAATPSPAAPLPLGSTVTQEPAPPAVPAPEETAPAEDAAPVTAQVAAIAAPAVKSVPPTAEPPPDAALLKLATRADHDRSRLAKAKGKWTAQLLVACRPETVERVLVQGGASPNLYVLPAQVKDDSCFRVCFGSYATQKDAATAGDLPKALRGKDKPGAVEIAKVLP